MKRLLLILLLSGMCWAVVTVDNTGQIATAQTNPISITSFAVGAGANRLLLVGTSAFNPTDILVTSVKFNTSTDLTILDRQAFAVAGGFEIVEFWYLKNPANVTANIDVTWPSSPQEHVEGATSWSGVDQSSTFGTVAKNGTDGTSTAPTVTVSSNSNAVVHDVVSADEFPGALTATGTQRWYGHSGVNGTAGGGQTKAGAASVVMNWTLVAATQHWSIMGVGINAAGAGGAICTMALLGVGPC